MVQLLRVEIFRHRKLLSPFAEGAQDLEAVIFFFFFSWCPVDWLGVAQVIEGAFWASSFGGDTEHQDNGGGGLATTLMSAPDLKGA